MAQSSALPLILLVGGGAALALYMSQQKSTTPTPSPTPNPGPSKLPVGTGAPTTAQHGPTGGAAWEKAYQAAMQKAQASVVPQAQQHGPAGGAAWEKAYQAAMQKAQASVVPTVQLDPASLMKAAQSLDNQQALQAGQLLSDGKPVGAPADGGYLWKDLNGECHMVVYVGDWDDPMVPCFLRPTCLIQNLSVWTIQAQKNYMAGKCANLAPGGWTR